MELLFLFYHIGLGSSEEHRKCSTWSGRCAKCSKKRTWTQGIFCANYYWTVAGFTPCHRMWCGTCYSSDPTVSFFVRHLENEGAESEKEPSDRARLATAWGNKRRAPDAFLRARDGDHTLIPFECDLCIFHKLRGHSPRVSNPVDGLLLACICLLYTSPSPRD